MFRIIWGIFFWQLGYCKSLKLIKYQLLNGKSNDPSWKFIFSTYLSQYHRNKNEALTKQFLQERPQPYALDTSEWIYLPVKILTLFLMTACSSLAFRSCCNGDGTTQITNISLGWPTFQQGSKTLRATVITVKCTPLLKRWERYERYSRVVSGSTRNIWTAWKLDVLPQLQIGQPLLKLKTIE